MACVDGRCESGRHYGCGCAGCPRCERFEDRVAELEATIDSLRGENFALAADQRHDGYDGGRGRHGCGEVDAANGRVTELLDTFRHTHAALYDMERLLDKCATCGLDIRHAIHRANRGPGEGE